jgi:hypothetical protein
MCDWVFSRLSEKRGHRSSGMFRCIGWQPCNIPEGQRPQLYHGGSLISRIRKYIASGSVMITEWCFGRDTEGSGRGQFQTLSRYLSGGTERNHEETQNNRCHVRDSNLAFPEYQSGCIFWADSSQCGCWHAMRLCSGTIAMITWTSICYPNTKKEEINEKFKRLSECHVFAISIWAKSNFSAPEEWYEASSIRRTCKYPAPRCKI